MLSAASMAYFPNEKSRNLGESGEIGIFRICLICWGFLKANPLLKCSWPLKWCIGAPTVDSKVIDR